MEIGGCAATGGRVAQPDVELVAGNAKEAVNGHFFNRPKPAAIRLHLVRDEVLAAL